MGSIQMLAEPDEGLYYDEHHRPQIRVVFPEEFQALQSAGVPVVDHETLWDPYYQRYFPSQATSRQLDLFRESR